METVRGAAIDLSQSLQRRQLSYDEVEAGPLKDVNGFLVKADYHPRIYTSAWVCWLQCLCFRLCNSCPRLPLGLEVLNKAATRPFRRTLDCINTLYLQFHPPTHSSPDDNGARRPGFGFPDDKT
jgi:hypothetical protein